MCKVNQEHSEACKAEGPQAFKGRSTHIFALDHTHAHAHAHTHVHTHTHQGVVGRPWPEGLGELLPTGGGGAYDFATSSDAQDQTGGWGVADAGCLGPL